MKYAVFKRKPQYGITNDIKINTKAAHNHFYRYSDVKVKGWLFQFFFLTFTKQTVPDFL